MSATQLQILAAHFREQGRSLKNFKKKKSDDKSQPKNCSASESSQKSSESALPDEDNLMDFTENEEHADKLPQKL
jgi:hypothetical protein